MAKIGLGALDGVTGLVKAGLSTNKALLDVPVAVTSANGRIVVQCKQPLLGFDPQTKSSNWSLFYAAPSDAVANPAMFAVNGNGQASAAAATAAG